LVKVIVILIIKRPPRKEKSARRGKKHWLAQKHPKKRVLGSDQKH